MCKHIVIWVKTYVVRTFNKKEDFSRLNYLRRDFSLYLVAAELLF